MFAASRSHDRQGGRKAARPYMVKPFKNHLGNQWTVFNRTDDSGYHCLFKLLPWVDLDLFYDKVKFCNLGFSIGKLLGAPCDRVGSKSHCRAVPAVPSPIWCASNLIFIDDVSFKL